MTLPVNNYNDIINILNASVKKINTETNTDTTNGRTDSVFSVFRPPTNLQPKKSGGPLGCAGCNNNPDLPRGEVVFARGGCLGRRVIKNLPTITEEEIGDIEFKWDYYFSSLRCGNGGEWGHGCGHTNFKLYINDVFVSDFDFNNISSVGTPREVHEKFKLKEKLNSSQLNNIIKNRTRRTCECQSKASSDSEECRELELQVKIFAVYRGMPVHVVGQIEFTIKNKTWGECTAFLFRAEYISEVDTHKPLVLLNPNPDGKGYCVCLPRKRWYPPDTDTATEIL